MRILLGNNTLAHFAGSETHVYSLAVELKIRGHHVVAFSTVLGEMAKKLQEAGIEVTNDLTGKKDDFDVIFSSHFGTTNHIKAKIPNVPIIFTLHGIIGNPEEPPLYCEQYVAVSEEIQDIYKERYGIDATIIRNGIDLERFNETKPRSEKPRKILLSSSYYTENSHVFNSIMQAAKIVNAELHCMGTHFQIIWDTPAIYNTVDMVITLGRGCLEAMACNRPVICLGHWGQNQELSADGLVTKDNIKEIRKNNFSSRRFRKEWIAKDIVEEILKYDNTTNYRELAKKDHDIRLVADKYLKLANIK